MDGTTVTTPAAYCWSANQSHTLTAPAVVPGANGSGYIFSNWGEGISGKTPQVTYLVPATPATILEANFLPAFQLTTVANPAN